MTSNERSKKPNNVQSGSKTNSENLITPKNLWIWIGLAVIFLTAFLIYFKALKFDILFCWDDEKYILENIDIRNLQWENIKSFFTKFYVSNYQPVTMLMYAAEYKVMGMSSALFHFNNIVLHLANTFLVYIFIRKISPQNKIVALITAAFFAVHPMHVESVAWISERKDVLYTFFFLISLIYYTNYLLNSKVKLLVFSGVFFLLSCLSKSAAVILPLVFLLLDYYLNRKIAWKIIFEKIPFFLISLIFGLVAIHSQQTALRPESATSFPNHIFIVLDAFVTYISRVFVPVNLSAIYPYPNLNGGSLPLSYFLSALFIVPILYGVWYSRKGGKDTIFGFGFFIITIILVIQIVSVGNATMADRYTYVPYIGLFFIVGKFYEFVSRNKNLVYKKFLLATLVFGFVVLAGISSARVPAWENDLTLYGNVLNQYPDCAAAYNNRGSYYLINSKAAVDSTRREEDLKKAIKDFDRVIEIDKNFPEIYTNKANSEYLAKNYSTAVIYFNKAIAENPKDIDVYYTRGISNYMIKNYDAAIYDFSKSIELNPTKVSAYYNRGLSRFWATDYYNAIKDLSISIKVDPTNNDSYNIRGLACYRIKDYSGAINDFSKTIELNPNASTGYYNRANAKVFLKDYKGALADYDSAIKINPKDPATISNRQIVKSILDK